jgi:hypothetical protein
MSPELPLERDAFNAFLDQQFVLGPNEATLEDALTAFRAYQRDLERLKEKLRPALEEADRSEGKPLDLDAVLQRIRDRVNQQESR